jgi:two-component system cell cycle sensor histidine kinase/response regulator CckA
VETGQNDHLKPLISGYTDDAAVLQELLDSSAAFLQKPFSPDTLVHKVSELLNSM